MDLKSKMESFKDKSIENSKLVELEGIPLLSELVENWNLISGFQARPDDLLLCTYPKAGTTWIQEIVDMVQHRGDAQKCARAPINERSPYIEFFLPKPIPSGFELALAMPSPRTLKSHFPVHLLPTSFWEQNCKIIYVARNAKDCAVSYFYFNRMLKMNQALEKWEDFLENFIAGKVAYGSWCDHVRGWWEAKDHHPILYLFYEDIKENPAREIQKVAEFLNIELSVSVLDQIVRHTMFENMKDNPMANYSNIPSFFMDQTVSPFMRKGTVGNWKEHFTVAQSEQLDEICIQQLGYSGLKFHTEL
ncbi:sulfotransferase 1C2-like [Protobothrops mucrosquamatus]|uniref:sulfotransferase 1C2-like n=1 Tax=Protobothrops mucrosquamatus TaxID=103944 RepID=UPI000775CF48|nr:sulfotransferase 1C2-like [Protobothrops mucrosquamatus]